MKRKAPATPKKTSRLPRAAWMVAAVVLVAGGAFLFIPLAAEKSADACQAAASQLARTQSISMRIGRYNLTGRIGGGLARSVGGPVVEEMVREKYPALPVVVGCSGAWWGILVMPQRTIRVL